MELHEARANLRKQIHRGTQCPCCDQYAREYRRKLNSTMARGLIWLVSEHVHSGDWVHVTRKAPRYLLQGGGEFAKLAHWGLVMQRQNDDERKRTSGQWIPTLHGIAFARNNVLVPSHVFLYNNRVTRFSDIEVSIVEALGRHFNYHELIGRNPIYVDPYQGN